MYNKKDFTVKKIVEFKGHEGEPLAQGDIYYKGRKLCFFSDGDWGGPPVIRWAEGAPFKERFFAEWVEDQNWTYPNYPDLKIRYDSFLSDVLSNALEIRAFTKKAKTGTVFKIAEDGDGEYRFIKQIKYPGTREFLLDKFGKEVKVFIAGEWKAIA